MAVGFGGGAMDGRFGGWESEDEPAVTGVYVAEAQSVAEEGAVSIGVGAVEHDVRAGNHSDLL